MSADRAADRAAVFAAVCQLVSARYRAVPRGRGTARTAAALPPLGLHIMCNGKTGATWRSAMKNFWVWATAKSKEWCNPSVQ